MIINSDWKAICLRYLAIQPGEIDFLRLPAECLMIERKDFDFMLAISIRHRNASAKDVIVSRQQEWLDGTISPTFSFMDLEADVKSRLLYRRSWNVKSAIIQELERGVSSYDEYYEISECIRACVKAIQMRIDAIELIEESFS